jgi:hypothetical protein
LEGAACEKPPKLANCGDANADGVPGWKGLPSKSCDGSKGVKFISKADPEAVRSLGL